MSTGSMQSIRTFVGSRKNQQQEMWTGYMNPWNPCPKFTHQETLGFVAPRGFCLHHLFPLKQRNCHGKNTETAKVLMDTKVSSFWRIVKMKRCRSSGTKTYLSVLPFVAVFSVPGQLKKSYSIVYLETTMM